MELKDILKRSIDLDASDIHLTVGVEPMVRVNGSLDPLAMEKISSSQIKKWVETLVGRQVIDQQEINTIYHFRNYRFRVSAYKERNVWAVAIRIISKEIKGLKELNLPNKLRDIVNESSGLFLVSGPTGSGKTTTLAALVNLINQNFSKHIITLEDPIEYLHQYQRSIINQRKIRRDTASFSQGLKTALRQDPDVIMIGEIRDLNTMSTALKAAETGHLILATLHTNNSFETIERIINVYPTQQQAQIRVQLSLTLLGVLAQKLVPTADALRRVVATELLLVNSAVKNLIREGKSHQIKSVLESSQKAGMHSMEYSLRDLYVTGQITLDMALRESFNKELLKKMI